MHPSIVNDKADRVPLCGRFAPSPTGPLHFGTLVAAVASFVVARRSGGVWRLRIEDLDTPRNVLGAADGLLRGLEALGMAWDGPVVYQSQRLQDYEEVLAALQQRGLAYPCQCSRRQVRQQARHLGPEGPVYPGTCRHLAVECGKHTAWRLWLEDVCISFEDGLQGSCRQQLAREVGDFVLRRADGVFAYQLAVVVDDAAAGITQVVRGRDLLLSTPRQIYLAQLLGYNVPEYIHLPLAVAADGTKFSKRHQEADCLTPRAPGQLLWQVLVFLGQQPPAELRRAPVAELWQWTWRHYAPERVPKQDQATDSQGCLLPGVAV